ncbi:MAG: alpha/beta hydrolase [Bacteroidetes bacterium]|nr:MAG: alpha/beta hydrolase [Bacteroidota bacterium]
MRVTTWLVVGTLFLTACGKKDTPVADPFDPAIAKVLRAEAYGTLPRQVMDLYLPASRGSSTKLLILLHGGFWSSGDKADLDNFIPLLQAQYPQLAIANINYRLANIAEANTQHPAQMADIKTLLDYCDKNFAKWHITNNYSLIGVSSGGHLSLLYAYAYDSPRRLKTVAGVVAPANFADPLYTSNGLFQNIAVNFLGKSWLQDSVLHKAASPSLVVSAGAIPTFLAYAGADALVPVSNATAMRNALSARGVVHQYHFYPSDGHELSPATIADLLTKHVAFLKLYH